MALECQYTKTLNIINTGLVRISIAIRKHGYDYRIKVMPTREE